MSAEPEAQGAIAPSTTAAIETAAPVPSVETTVEEAPNAADTSKAEGENDGPSEAKEAAEASAPAVESTDAPPETVSTEVPATSTPNASSKNKKRRSSAGVPEHKSKKLNRKKSMPNLHLDVQPGQYWFARMKGHPSWPAIVCDEAMLPESLLSKRPVSAWRPDGSYRADFMEDGKNAKDRRYPVMFLGTNEFYWMVNTELEDLDKDELKRAVENDERGKKSKALWDAYQIASEDHDLDHFKDMLVEHERARMNEAQERAEREAKKNQKKEKGKRKSTADGDVDMDDAGSGEATKKSSKKRKKEADSEGENLKTPKTKLKVNGPKAPAAGSETKAKKGGSSKKAKTEPEPEVQTAKQPAPPRFGNEDLNTRFKTLYFLRFKLQKGFLSQEPKDEEMEKLNDFLTEVEQHGDADGLIIRESRIHRVLKNMVKLTNIPREEDFQIKKRCLAVLSKWSKALGRSEGEGAAKSEPATNGVEKKESSEPAAAPDSEAAPLSAVPDVKMDVSEAEPTSAEAKDTPVAVASPPAAAEEKKTEDGDVTMEDAEPDEAKPEEAKPEDAKPQEAPQDAVSASA